MQSEYVAGQGRQYLTFDDPGVLAAARRDPNGFIAGLNRPVTLYEVPHTPEIFPVVKASIDRKRQPGKFVLTGSPNVMLLSKLSESLAGRMEMLTLWPFSQEEIHRLQENFMDRVFSTRPVAWSNKLSAMPWEELLKLIVA